MMENPACADWLTALGNALGALSVAPNAPRPLLQLLDLLAQKVDAELCCLATVGDGKPDVWVQAAQTSLSLCLSMHL